MADDGQSVIVFGGLEVDKNTNEFGGDTLYSDELYWFSAQLDEEEGQIKPLGMHWYGPLPEFQGANHQVHEPTTQDRQLSSDKKN